MFVLYQVSDVLVMVFHRHQTCRTRESREDKATTRSAVLVVYVLLIWHSRRNNKRAENETKPKKSGAHITIYVYTLLDIFFLCHSCPRNIDLMLGVQMRCSDEGLLVRDLDGALGSAAFVICEADP